MATPKMTRPEVIAAENVFGQDLTDAQRQPKLDDILGRFWDTAVRISVNTLTPEDIDLAKWSNAELAEALRTHAFRQGGIRNGIFDKILEAADRLSPPMVGDYFVDYSPLTPEELARPDPEMDKLLANSRRK